MFQVYQNNQAAIDDVLGKVKVQIDEVKGKVVALIPSQVSDTFLGSLYTESFKKDANSFPKSL